MSISSAPSSIVSVSSISSVPVSSPATSVIASPSSQLIISGSSSAPASVAGSSSAKVSLSSVPTLPSVAVRLSTGSPSSVSLSHLSLPSVSSIVSVVTSAATRDPVSPEPSRPIPPTRAPLPPVVSASSVITLPATPTSISTAQLPTRPTAIGSLSVRPVKTTSPDNGKTLSAPAARISSASTVAEMQAQSSKAPAKPSAAPVNHAASPPSDSSAQPAPSQESSDGKSPDKGPGSSSVPPAPSSSSKPAPPFTLPGDPAPSASESSESSNTASETLVKPHTNTASTVSPTVHSSASSPSSGTGGSASPNPPPPSSSSSGIPHVSNTSDFSSQPLFQVPTQAPSPPSGSSNVKVPTSTHTITVPPESTFTSPVFVTGTDSKGKPTPSLPPVITSVGVSTEPDGVQVSVTHIIANPTGIWGISDNTTASKHGFLANSGAVAGVFVVVGIVVAAIASVVAFIMCKRRRRRRIRTSISRPLPMPQNPFEDPREAPSPPQMRYAPSDTSNRNLVGHGLGMETPVRRSLLDDEFEDAPGPAVTHAAEGSTGFAGIGAGGKSIGRPAYNAMPSYNGPFNHYVNVNAPVSRNINNRLTHASRPSNASSAIGLAITSEETQQNTSGLAPVDNVNSVLVSPTPRHLKHASLTPSTPSIYPPSLPGVDDAEDTSTDDTHGFPLTPSTDEGVVLPLGEAPARPPRKRPAPPLPPRSPLRPSSKHMDNKLTITTQLQQLPPVEAPSKPEPAQEEYVPLTPPASTISYSSFGSEQEVVRPVVAMPRPVVARSLTSPFEEYNRMMSRTMSMTGKPVKENFYTRRKVVNPEMVGKTSVEWKQ